MNRFRASAILLATLSLPSCRKRLSNPADLVLLNGRIVTLDSITPEAQALAVRGGKVVQVGDNRTIEALAGPETKKLDLGGKLAIPAFIEGHGHFMSLGL